jgi:hypothetical protein
MERELKMRTLIAALTIVLLTVAAHAQSNPSLGTSRGQRTGYPHKEMKPRYHKEIDAELHRTKDQAYQDALKKIPDSKEEHDPWKSAR